MKTASVLTKRQSINMAATMKKVSVNPELHPNKVISKRPANQLNIQGYEFREWLEHLNSSTGLYYLDLNQNAYSMHYKHYQSGKLMTLDSPEDFNISEDPKKEYLESLLFDLSLFPEEPVLTFNSDLAEKELRNLSAIYYEQAKEIDCIISRLVNIDLKKIFDLGIYSDSRVQELSIDGIYHSIYPGSSISFKKSNASYGLYLVVTAMQSVFYQVTGKKVSV